MQGDDYLTNLSENITVFISFTIFLVCLLTLQYLAQESDIYPDWTEFRGGLTNSWNNSTGEFWQLVAPTVSIIGLLVSYAWYYSTNNSTCIWISLSISALILITYILISFFHPHYGIPKLKNGIKKIRLKSIFKYILLPSILLNLSLLFNGNIGKESYSDNLTLQRNLPILNFVYILVVCFFIMYILRFLKNYIIKKETEDLTLDVIIAGLLLGIASFFTFVCFAVYFDNFLSAVNTITSILSILWIGYMSITIHQKQYKSTTVLDNNLERTFTTPDNDKNLVQNWYQVIFILCSCALILIFTGNFIYFTVYGKTEKKGIYDYYLEYTGGNGSDPAFSIKNISDIKSFTLQLSTDDKVFTDEKTVNELTKITYDDLKNSNKDEDIYKYVRVELKTNNNTQYVTNSVNLRESGYKYTLMFLSLSIWASLIFVLVLYLLINFFSVYVS